MEGESSLSDFLYGTLNKGVDVASKYLGPSQPQIKAPAPAVPKTDNNLFLIIGGALAVVLVLVFALRR